MMFRPIAYSMNTIVIKPFVDHFDYPKSSVFTADETYIKVRGIKGYIWFIMDDQEKNKVFKFNERWEELREESHGNIQSEKGILNRQVRSIQTEGHFGDIKGNEDFRRFNYRTTEKVYKEFMLYTMGRNLNKYHRFVHGKIKKFEGKPEQKTA